ncbi:uncharacterized protein LOC124358551 [Homalodisca vitripennis]|uniref:uncharacterized protein LOC124358551 n=1 Tax=Homalodisca vitripennis TaxID=197043 RepID=UPI001EE9BC57|nr:uncharacterized protein LOC124358551 [Homalodisca vitripennis]
MAEPSRDPVEVCNVIGLKLSRLLNKMRNKLTQAGQLTVEEYFAKIRDLAVHLHQENLILKSKLNERAVESPLGKELLQTCQVTVKEISKSAKTLSESTSVQSGRPSYAAMGAVAPPVTVQGQGRKVAKPHGDKCTALIYPKDSTPNTSSETTKALIQMTVKPQVMGLKIRRISKILNNGVALEVENAEQLRKLEEIKELRCIVNIKKSKKRRPKVLVYDVPKELDGKTLTEVVYAQNNERKECTLENFQKSFRPLFKTGPKNKPTNNWVCEVSAETRNSLIRAGRVFINWASCKVIDHHIVTRCYKCQRYGHMAKDCKSEVDVCGHCAATGHETKACSHKGDKTKAKCVHCSGERGSGRHSGHPSGDRNCPKHQDEINRLVSLTDYGC